MKTHVVIGLEMHCEMKSTSKVFSPAPNGYSQYANSNICEVCLGFPGILPTVNEECVKKALEAALILNCKIPNKLIFDRKHYYYPDLPKGYQITQGTLPIGVKGNIDIEVNGKIKNVTIQDIHLEEDAAALEHLETISLIDYNRCGVPLIECVTDPVFTSSDEALAFIDTMCKIYQYTGISDADTKKGQIRCDVNVNLQDENGKFVTPKVEMKNMNSLQNIKDAILYEEERQTKAYNEGNISELIQETRRWDEEKGETIHMRSKVDAIDYKYYVDPNIYPFEITSELINEVKSKIPRLALERKQEYVSKYNLDEESARIIVKDINISNYYEKCLNLGINAKLAANWLTGIIISTLNTNEENINEFYITPVYLKQILDNMDNGNISSKQAKEIFFKAIEERKEPSMFITKDNAQVSDEDELEKIIDNILNNNQKQIEDYHNGKSNLFDYFVGQVMKETRGKANPNITKELLNKKLN